MVFSSPTCLHLLLEKRLSMRDDVRTGIHEYFDDLFRFILATNPRMVDVRNSRNEDPLKSVLHFLRFSSFEKKYCKLMDSMVNKTAPLLIERRRCYKANEVYEFVGRKIPMELIQAFIIPHLFPSLNVFNNSNLYLDVVVQIPRNSVAMALTEQIMHADPFSPLSVSKSNHCNPLHFACASHVKISIMKLLLTSPAREVMAQGEDVNGCIPLHHCIVYNASIRKIKELLIVYPDGVKARNKSGRTVLHLALVFNSRIEIIECLVKACPQALLEKTDDDKYPFDIISSLSCSRTKKSNLSKILSIESRNI